MSSLGTMSTGMTEYNKSKYAWHTTRREMAYKTVQSAEEVRQMENELAEIEGVQKTRYAASGVRTDEGSPMDVQLATLREGRHQIEFKKAMDAAEIFEMRKAGRLQKKAGQMALWGSIATTVGNTASSVFANIAGQGQAAGSPFDSLASSKMKNPVSGKMGAGGGSGGFNFFSLLGSL